MQLAGMCKSGVKGCLNYELQFITGCMQADGCSQGKHQAFDSPHVSDSQSGILEVAKCEVHSLPCLCNTLLHAG